MGQEMWVFFILFVVYEASGQKEMIVIGFGGRLRTGTFRMLNQAMMP